MNHVQGSMATMFALVFGVLGLSACGDDSGDATTQTTTTTAATDATTQTTTTTAATAAPTTTDAPTTTAGESGTGTTGGEGSDDVVEIAIRRLNPNQDVGAFAAARDAFVALLKAQPGVGTDREFVSFLDYAIFMPPDPPVYVGMTQYNSLADFAAAGEVLGNTPEAGAFFSTFTPELFTVLTPLEPGAPVDLAGVADGPGQVLEIAVRDLKNYANFDPADYASKRDAFLTLLSAQAGFVAEYQWVSVLDPDLAVGMTVYESTEAFAALSMDQGFIGAPEVAAFLGAYPPTGGHVNAVVK